MAKIRSTVVRKFMLQLKPAVSPELSVAFLNLTKELVFFAFGFRRYLPIGDMPRNLIVAINGKRSLYDIARKFRPSTRQLLAYVMALEKSDLLDVVLKTKISFPEAPKINPPIGGPGNNTSVILLEDGHTTETLYRILRNTGFTHVTIVRQPNTGLTKKLIKEADLIVGAVHAKKTAEYLNRLCLHGKTKWIPYRTDLKNSRTDVGPFIKNDTSGCHWCYTNRIAQNYFWKKEDVLLNGSNKMTSDMAEKIETNLAQHLASCVFSFLKEDLFGKGTVLTLDYLSGKVIKNRLLPQPLCTFCIRPKVRSSEMNLKKRTTAYFENGFRIISAKQAWKRIRPYIGHLGIVSRVYSHNNSLSGLINYHAISADPLGNNRFRMHAGKGISSIQSRNSAVFEAAERYCAKFALLDAFGENVRDAYVHIKNRAIHPSRFQMLPPGYTDSRESVWTPAWSLTGNYSCLIPNHFVAYIPIGSNGLASGNCIEEAILHGIFEQIERDIYMITDLNCLNMPDLDLDGLKNTQIFSLLDRLDKAGFSYHIKYLLNNISVPTFGMYLKANVAGKTGRSHVVCSHLDKEIALSRTITEAMQVFPKFATGHRWLDKNTGHYVTPGGKVTFSSIPQRTYPELKKNIDLCVAMLKKQRLEVFVVNHTIADMKTSVVRVLIAGLQPIWFKEDPYLVDRVFSLPVSLGFKKKKPQELNYGQFAGIPFRRQ